MGLWGVLRTVLLVGIVMAAVTLTGLRLVGSDDGLAVMVTAFAPYGLLLWAAVLGHAAFRTITGPRRVLWSVAAALVVLPLALHGWWLAPSYVGAQPDAATGATSFRLMTANLLAGRGDGAELLASAVREDVDVLVVEEVDEAALALMESAGLDSAFPHRAGEPGTALEGTMIFSAYPLSDTAEVPVSLGGWATTAATPDGPVRVLGAHTHPPSITLGYAGSDHAILREAAAGADVVTGDLNATPDTGPMLRLDYDGWRSAAEVANAGWQPTWPAYGSRRLLGIPLPPLVQIDHVLVRDTVVVLDVETLAVAGSDHRALVAELALK